jgi:hypothetical protein
MNVFTTNNYLKTVAIAVSSNVYHNLGGVGNVGGIIGMSYYLQVKFTWPRVLNII